MSIILIDELITETSFEGAKLEADDGASFDDHHAAENLDVQFNSIRLIIRNCQAELGTRHWLYRDLKAVERWLNGETRLITTEGVR